MKPPLHRIRLDGKPMERTRIYVPAKIVELLQPIIDEMEISLTAYVTTVLMDHIRGVRRVGAEPLIPKPPKVYAADRKAAAEAVETKLRRHKWMLEHYPDIDPRVFAYGTLYNPTEFAKFMFERRFPDLNADEYYKSDELCADSIANSDTVPMDWHIHCHTHDWRYKEDLF